MGCAEREVPEVEFAVEAAEAMVEMAVGAKAALTPSHGARRCKWLQSTENYFGVSDNCQNGVSLFGLQGCLRVLGEGGR